MTTGELLQIEPLEIQFPFELMKQMSCSLQLTNKSDDYVAFKVKTTNPKKYCVKPNTGVVIPRSTCGIVVTMQAQKEAPLDLQCKDKFLLQSVVSSPGSTVKDVTAEMFSKESGNNHVDECKLRVVYVQPPVYEEAHSLRASASVNGITNSNAISLEQNESTPQAKSLVSRLTEENHSFIQQNKKLEQELELLRCRSIGFPFVYLIVVIVVGFVLGYILKRG